MATCHGALRIDMTAMVDVAFLLLTFFMLTTSFKPPETVAIELPSSRTEIKLPATDVLQISVDDGGALFVGADATQPEQPVTLDDLSAVIVQLRSQNPGLRSVIRADRRADYGPVEDVMAALQAANVHRFSFITDVED
jgi:biopolymer transport protein ExbD